MCFADQAGKHFAHVGDDSIEIENARLKTCMRLKASNWRVMVTALPAAF